LITVFFPKNIKMKKIILFELFLIFYVYSQCDISDCTDCVKVTSCVWCQIASNESICVPGNVFSPNTNWTCGQWFYGQCQVSGNKFPAIYLLIIAGVGVVVILLVITIIVICLKNKKRGNGGCCPSTSISNKNYKQGEEEDKMHNYKIVAQPVVRDVDYTTTTTKTDKPMILPTINMDDIDRENLPPGFEDPPPKPEGRKGMSEAEYKEFMIAKLKYETWENKLLLYYRKKAQEEKKEEDD